MDQNEAWSRLDIYTSHDVLKRSYLKRHAANLKEERASQIISHFLQGKQFFAASASSGSLAAPLQQYYGALALARGLILYLAPHVKQLEPKHGLTSSLQGPGLEDIRIDVEGEGTFPQLVAATKNKERLEIATNAETTPRFATRELPGPATPTSFFFRDLLKRMPHLRTQYEEAYDSLSCCYPCKLWWITHRNDGVMEDVRGKFRLELYQDTMSLPDSKDLQRNLAMNDWVCIASPPGGAYQYVSPDGKNTAYNMLPPIDDISLQGLPPILASADTVCGPWQADFSAVEPFVGGWSLSTFMSYYVCAYVLSMIVRYYPERRAKLLGAVQGDALLPVIEKFRALMQSNFVTLTLEQLDLK